MSQLMTKPDVSTIDSREVAEMVSKQHKELLRDIRKYASVLTSAGLRSLDYFIPSEYLDVKKEIRPCYELTIIGCDLVANKLIGEKGILFTAQYAKRFREMEENERNSTIKVHLPSYPEALRLYADEMERNSQLSIKNQEQAVLIESYELKVNYLNEILHSKSTLNITQIAADYDLTAQELNKILHEEKIQKKSGNQWVLCKKYFGQGYVKSDTYSFSHKNGNRDVSLHTKWTQKGRMLIHEILKERTIYAILDK